MEALDQELVATLCTDVVGPSEVERLLKTARQVIEASDRDAGVWKELAATERERERPAESIAMTSAPLPTLVDRMSRAESTRQRPRRQLAVSRAVDASVERIRGSRPTNRDGVRARFSGSTPTRGRVTDLLIAIPEGRTAVRQENATYTYFDNGTFGAGLAQVDIGGDWIRLLKAGFVNWSASSGATNIYLQIDIPLA